VLLTAALDESVLFVATLAVDVLQSASSLVVEIECVVLAATPAPQAVD